MSRNITVGISDELFQRMEQFKDVNWSAVTRDCIEQYIKQRTAKGLEQSISKIKAMRGHDFKTGYDFVIEHSEKIGLVALEEIAYPEPDNHEELLFGELPDETWAKDLFRYDRDRDGNPYNIRYRVSSDFVKGMREAAKELVERSE